MKLGLFSPTFRLAFLAGQVLCSPLEQRQPQAELSTLEPMSGYDQGSCPDSRFGLNLRSEKGLFGWFYEIRWQGGCGCSLHTVSVDGCGLLEICGGKHRVCLDWRSRRGHWVDTDGHKTCYSMDYGFVCAKKKWEAWPTAEVACTW